MWHELSRARAELALLEEQARWLLKELLHVRAAVDTQRAKVDELIRTRPTAFNLLPTEILLSILELDVRAYDYPERKDQLASVCRRWKTIILDSPSLWTTIHVATPVSSIMTHLERSRGSLLDIVIETSLMSRSQHLALVPSLVIVGSSAHRWHKLSISPVDQCFNVDEEDRSDDIALAEFIITRINHLQFPSLKYVSITNCTTSLDFLSPTRTPALEHLELKEFIVGEHTEFPSVTALKTLNLDFHSSGMDYSSSPYLVPSQTLTHLSLSGFTQAFSLQSNSLHFPSLKMLEISRLAKVGQFMDAIVAPNLERFKYTSFDYDHSPFVLLHGFRPKFTNIRYLTFHCPDIEGTPEPHCADAIALCEAFPGARYVELKTNQLCDLFDPTLSSSRTRPIDLWTELESLNLGRPHPKWLEPNQFLGWLVDRRALGLRKLHVKLEHLPEYDLGPSHRIDFKFPRLYEVLKDNCILELDNFPLTLPEMRLYMPVKSRLRMVTTSFLYAGLYSLYICLALVAPNNRAHGRHGCGLSSGRHRSWLTTG